MRCAIDPGKQKVLLDVPNVGWEIPRGAVGRDDRILIVAVLATLLLPSLSLPPSNSAALVRGRRLSQLTSATAPAALEATGIARMLGMTFYVAVGIGTQASALAWKFSLELDGDAPRTWQDSGRATQKYPTTLERVFVGRSK